jgi:stage V sporulation protein S
MTNLIKVGSGSKPSLTAGAVAGMIRDNGACQVQAIGAGAVNQAVKAVAIARSYLQKDFLELVAVPSFQQVDIHGEEKTAIRFYIESRPLADAPQIPVGSWRAAEFDAEP